MEKIKIGNLTHHRRKCNCDNTAKWYIFTLNGKKKSIFYKCDDCMELIKNVVFKIDLEIKSF